MAARREGRPYQCPFQYQEDCNAETDNPQGSRKCHQRTASIFGAASPLAPPSGEKAALWGKASRNLMLRVAIPGLVCLRLSGRGETPRQPEGGEGAVIAPQPSHNAWWRHRWCHSSCAPQRGCSLQRERPLDRLPLCPEYSCPWYRLGCRSAFGLDTASGMADTEPEFLLMSSGMAIHYNLRTSRRAPARPELCSLAFRVCVALVYSSFFGRRACMA